MECPESIEELEALEKRVEEQLLNCRKKLLQQAQARLDAGTAKSERDAARQLAEEMGESPEAVHKKIMRERHKQSGTGVPKSEVSEYEHTGPILNGNGELPPEYQELDKVGDALNLELPSMELHGDRRRLWGINRTVAWFMRFAYARNNIPEEIKEWFGRNRRERGEDRKCWLCTNRKAQTKLGLCAKCREVIKDDRRKIEIQKRTICDEQTRVWNELKKDFDELIEKVDAVLESDSPPRIESVLAGEIIHYGKTIYHGLLGNLQDVAYQDCFT